MLEEWDERRHRRPAEGAGLAVPRDHPADRGVRPQRSATPTRAAWSRSTSRSTSSGRWWEQLLHNQTALRLKGRLLFTPGRDGDLGALPAALLGARQAARRAGASTRSAPATSAAASAARPPHRRRTAARTCIEPGDRRRPRAEEGPRPVPGRRAVRRRAPSGSRTAGFVVARHEGVVVFVRHALPGERVVVEVTEGQEGDRFLRADAVEVLEASPDRVEPALPVRRARARAAAATSSTSRSPAQRRLKAAVVAEQLQRLAGLDVDVEVEAVPGDDDGLDWRTRVQWAVTARRRPPGCASTAPTTSSRSTTAGSRTPGCRRSPHEWPDATASRRSSPRPASSCRLVTTRTARRRRRAAGAHRAGRRSDLAGHRLRLLAGAPRRRRHAGRRGARRARPAAGGAGRRPLLRGRAVHRRAGRARSG